jgi:hypothetical protein
MPTIEWKLDAGHILTIAVLLVGMAVTWGATQTKLEANGAALADMKAQITELRVKVDRIRDEQVRNTTLLDEQVQGSKAK